MDNNKVVVNRTVKAPVEKVWKAFTDQDKLNQWFAPEGLTPVVKTDVAVGGNLHVRMEQKDNTHIAVGTYTEIVENEKLAFSWKWEGESGPETLVTVTFKKLEDNKTEVTFTHSGFTDEKEVEAHNTGWVSAFNKLEALFAS